MSSKTFDPNGEFERLARQYWSAWSGFAPQAPANGPMPGFKDGLAWWTQLAGRGNDDINAALERTQAQAGQWFGAMQELVAKFAEKPAGAADIAAQWNQLLAGTGGNPMADMFQRMAGADARGFDAWMTQAAPMLGSLRSEANTLLGLPAFGLAREHQERLQKLAQAQLAYQDRIKDYNALLARVGQGAFARFESKLAERSEPGRQIESARALFDLWIDAAEEAWNEVALGTEYRQVYAELVNAQMRLRAGVQREIELVAGQFGLPTRSEINASHRKVAMLERELRALKAQAASVRDVPVAPAGTDAPRPAAKRAAARRDTPSKARPAKRVAAKPAPRKLVLPQVIAPRAASKASPAPKTKPATRKAR